MKFMVNACKDFPGGCTPVLTMEVDAMRDSWIDHYYTCGIGGLVTTFQEVGCIFEVIWP